MKNYILQNYFINKNGELCNIKTKKKVFAVTYKKRQTSYNQALWILAGKKIPKGKRVSRISLKTPPVLSNLHLTDTDKLDRVLGLTDAWDNYYRITMTGV